MFKRFLIAGKWILSGSGPLSKIMGESFKLSFSRNWCIKVITSAVFFVTYTKKKALLKLPTHYGFKCA